MRGLGGDLGCWFGLVWSVKEVFFNDEQPVLLGKKLPAPAAAARLLRAGGWPGRRKCLWCFPEPRSFDGRGCQWRGWGDLRLLGCLWRVEERGV